MRPRGCSTGCVILVRQHEQQSVDGVLDDQRDPIADAGQRHGERREGDVPVRLRVRTRRVRAVRSAHPGDARLRADRAIRFFVGLARGEARGTLSAPRLQCCGVFFEALADRVQLGRVERFWDLLRRRGRLAGGNGAGGGGGYAVVEEVRPACARVLLLEVQREQAVGLRAAVRVPRPETRRGRDGGPETRRRVARGVVGAALDEERERLWGEEDVDVRFGCGGGEGERDCEFFRVLRPGVGRRFGWRGGRGGDGVCAGYEGELVC